MTEVVIVVGVVAVGVWVLGKYLERGERRRERQIQPQLQPVRNESDDDDDNLVNSR